MNAPAVSHRMEQTLVAVTVVLAAVVLAADSFRLLEVDWGWGLAFISLCGGLGLIATAPESRGMFVGALARFTPAPGTLVALRVATVVTAPLAGFGSVAYLMLALAQSLTEPRPREFVPEWRRVLGTALLGLAFVLAASELGLVVGGEAVLWPILVGATALAGFWWLPGPTRAVRVAGSAAVVLGLLPLTTIESAAAELLLAAGAGALALILVAGPRVLRGSRMAALERAGRARLEERAEVAEMVHDSVLQTLALIQSRADDPVEVKALARTQERDLRARIFGDVDPLARPASIATALKAAAAEVEDAHRTQIDVVTVGDGPLDERAQALVGAAREALVNAVTHAHGAAVSLFAEIDDRRVAAYVRDRGPGFDLAEVPADRRGVSDSIVARMVRHGGHTVIRSAPGGGTEVQLVLERR
jgi:signal transduction histidine kinase